MSKDTTELLAFQVLDCSGAVVLPTVLQHHYDNTTGYELITITQTNEDGSTDCVCMSRGQLAAITSIAKGH